MSPLRVMIVDDELLARRRLLRLLSAMPDVVIAGEHERGEDALAHASSADVVLLDVEMPGLSGIEALQLWPVDGPSVVLCTAYPDHAIAAFDGGASDYLLKPVSAQRLALALTRARSRGPSPAPARPAAARLAIESAHGIVLLDPLEIGHLSLDGELVTLHTRNGSYLSAEPMSELSARLPADVFVRVHRRALVNLSHVERFDPVPTGGLVARMKDGALVPVSRLAARGLRRRWRMR
ncbi:MAG: LytTR family DNA-binding domain-containing protein [Polyangia bacterium]